MLCVYFVLAACRKSEAPLAADLVIIMLLCVPNLVMGILCNEFIFQPLKIQKLINKSQVYMYFLLLKEKKPG